MPPSERAILTSGNLLIAADQNRSAAACTMFIGWSVIITSGGASTAETTIRPEEPMCTLSTVPQSDSARHSGSQWSVWKLG